MTHEGRKRDAEDRKLEALLAISKAVTELGCNLTAMVSQSLDNGRKLDGMDHKLNRLLTLLDQPERTKTAG